MQAAAPLAVLAQSRKLFECQAARAHAHLPAGCRGSSVRSTPTTMPSISQGSLRRSISMGVNSGLAGSSRIESLCGDKSSRSPLHSTSPRRSGH